MEVCLSKMTKICSFFLCFYAVVYASMDVNDLQRILSKQELNEFPVDISSQLSPSVPVTKAEVRDILESQVNKFVRKLLLLANKKQKQSDFDRQSIQKRPFCNGFFGCTNGKRSQSAPLVPPMELSQDFDNRKNQKRMFCNYGGCFSGKRSLINALLSGKESDNETDLN